MSCSLFSDQVRSADKGYVGVQSLRRSPFGHLQECTYLTLVVPQAISFTHVLDQLSTGEVCGKTHSYYSGVKETSGPTSVEILLLRFFHSGSNCCPFPRKRRSKLHTCNDHISTKKSGVCTQMFIHQMFQYTSELQGVILHPLLPIGSQTCPWTRWSSPICIPGGRYSPFRHVFVGPFEWQGDQGINHSATNWWQAPGL